jgi:hypothetical protein
MNHTKRVAEATTSCANKENNQPLISESSPLNQRDIVQQSMDEKNDKSSIKDNIITLATSNLASQSQNPVVRYSKTNAPTTYYWTSASLSSYAAAVSLLLG